MVVERCSGVFGRGGVGGSMATDLRISLCIYRQGIPNSRIQMKYKL